jgi:hypothetical protein
MEYAMCILRESSSKKDSRFPFKSSCFLARLGGLGPPTCGLEVRCSIQLSYRRISFLLIYLHYLAGKLNAVFILRFVSTRT